MSYQELQVIYLQYVLIQQFVNVDFLTLGWLFHKRCLNLNVNKLEFMCKLILYWKSNLKTEFGFYGIDQKKILVLVMMRSIIFNIRIAETFAKDNDKEYNEKQASTQRLTISGETILEDNCYIVIKNILNDSDENNVEGDEVDDSGNNKRAGEDDYDYDIDNVLDIVIVIIMMIIMMIMRNNNNNK
ncbi:hypothetical protein RhiirA4_485012 [Rhizophagus irregularis]|uniref:Uncharacterized protein n=1 Tax=Rhizophagus irregularis TaxID=588596 RepID=A0A2I1HPN2_9GLOM|nr:hypothetical protein RhiirA4_485012 [Rhizophagus irregularis]